MQHGVSDSFILDGGFRVQGSFSLQFADSSHVLTCFQIQGRRSLGSEPQKAQTHPHLQALERKGLAQPGPEGEAPRVGTFFLS